VEALTGDRPRPVLEPEPLRKPGWSGFL